MPWQLLNLLKDVFTDLVFLEVLGWFIIALLAYKALQAHEKNHKQ